MGLFGVTTGKDYIHFAGRSDVCVLCARNKARSERMDLTIAQTRLKGHLEGNKVMKIVENGAFVVLCSICVQKIMKDLSEEGKEES